MTIIDENNNIIINPTLEQIYNWKMELIVIWTFNKINMIKAEAKEISGNLILKAILDSNNIIKKLINFQNKIIFEINIIKIKVKLFKIKSEIIICVNKNYSSKLIVVFKIKEKNINYKIKKTLYDIVKNEIIIQILNNKICLDKRKINQIRSISSKIYILSVVHGSSLFTRKEKQVLSIVTLDLLKENQIINDFTNKKTFYTSL